MTTDLPIQWWPLSGLRLTTPRVELRWPSHDDLVALAELARDGIHDPSVMPFSVAWTDAPPAERARSTMQWHWRAWAELTAGSWRLPFVVSEGGRVVGMQELDADKFAVRREVLTGSWLGRAHQGRGIGTHMRAAVLHLAFAELGAEWATTAAFDDNPASNGVTRRLGYQPDGIEIAERRGKPARLLRYRLSREQWQRQDRISVRVTGIDGCRALLGADWSDD
jgi:RimJ/RimL family protein N-acetyltransferase